MTWPASQDYNEAVQSPSVNFNDAELKRGAAAVGALGLPLPCSGTFADVYEIRCPDGGHWAVKCFTREVPGLRERYEAIGDHLRQARLSFTVDFRYLEKGIQVAHEWCPVLKMEWACGLPLNQFVAENLDAPATLASLGLAWARVGRYLRAAGVGHCDLQHGNVLLVPDSGANSLALKLVDYDGMWVPALAGKPSGEAGHPNYQHPGRAREQTYSREVDRFPLLLVATALRALQTGGRALWERYDTGDNLLFIEADLRAPDESPLFGELRRSSDEQAVALATRMIEALRGGVESAELIEEPTPARPPPAAPPPPEKAAGLPEWLSALGEAVTAGEDVTGLPPPAPASWLADVRRAEQAPPPRERPDR
jgi:hypothetical protein